MAYRIRTPGNPKADRARQWALPDRVFFAAGACHILAHAFLVRHGRPDMSPLWIKPGPGFWGNHILIAAGDWVFDYHGYAERERALAHFRRRAAALWPGWHGSLHELPREVLVSEAASRRIEGLWLREPGQFLHDALPRAFAYLDRFPPPPPRESGVAGRDRFLRCR